MPGLQQWIHAMEEGRGATIIKTFLAVFGFVAIAIAYNFLCFKNFYIPEAMDTAQLARNMAEGEGYTTDFVRPLSIHLLQEHRADRSPMLKAPHPDLANAPVYPLIVSALFKAKAMNYNIPRKAAFTTYQPERWIAGLNQFLFFCAVLLVFFIAFRLFNSTIAWISALVLAGTELLWRFSVSGLSTQLLMVLVLGVVYCLVRMDEWQRQEAPSLKKLLGFGILTGVLVGLAGLTRYSFLWLILPTLLFVLLFTPRYRIKVPIVVLLSFLIVVAPWIIRNHSASGKLFGISTYAILEQTATFPENTLQRSLTPNFEKVTVKNLTTKLFVNTHDILENQVLKLGGSWVAAFFLAGLLVPFRNPTAVPLRIFLASSLILFVMVQALGRTHLSDVSKVVNSENLLVVFAPVVFIFGVAMFFLLIDQIKLATPIRVKMSYAAFIVAVSAPLLFTLLPPGSRPFAYPPYHPPLIQETCSWMKKDELMMSDVPWALAWYGDRQCVALTLNREKEFFTLNDDIKRVQALYLSPQTTDGRFLSQILQPTTWEQLAFQAVARGGDATGNFPLRSERKELMPHHLFLTDFDRWNLPKN